MLQQPRQQKQKEHEILSRPYMRRRNTFHVSGASKAKGGSRSRVVAEFGLVGKDGREMILLTGFWRS